MKKFKFHIKIVLVNIFLLVAFFNAANGNNKTWNEYYNEAKVATYYSASVLNGYYDLKLAFLYVDSTKAAINASNLSSGDKMLANAKVNELIAELNISRLIAQDNMNYRYPVYSLMSGHRSEFNVIDDTEELLIESIVDRIINSPDPIWKGNLKDNTHFVLINVSPFNEVHFTVILDYLAGNTGFNACRLHDLQSILGEEGYKKFQNAKLDSSDYKKLLSSLGIDKMIILNVKDNGSGINNLFYKGITLQTISANDLNPKYVTYYEGFKRDKEFSEYNSLWVYLLNTLVFIILLFLLIGIRYNGKIKKVEWIYTKEKVKSTILLCLSSILSVLLSYYISGIIHTEINMYYADLNARLWVAYQILFPTILSFGLSYLLLFKFSNEVVNSKQGITKILFASIVFPSALLSYFESYAEPFPQYPIYYISLIPAILFIPTSILGGIVINNIIKKDKNTILQLTSFVVGIILYFVSVWGDLRDDLTISLITAVSSSLISFLALVKLNKSIKSILVDNVASNSLYSLMNPKTYFTKGLNIIELRSEINDLLSNPMRKGIIVKGELGIGKTRFINEINKHVNGNVVFYKGDCNEHHEGNSQLYEPFFNAFCQYSGGVVDNLPKGFFSDRSSISKNLNKVVKVAGSAAPIDVSNVLTLEDEGSARSIQEIVSELIEVLLKRETDNSLDAQVLIIDDFQWVDSSTKELLVELTKQLEIRSKFTSKIKIVLFTEHNSQTLPSTIDESKLVGYSEFELKIDNPKLFIETIVSTKNLEIDETEGYYFTALLKSHLQSICLDEHTEFTPGDFFGYLEALYTKGYINMDGKALRLTHEPDENENINLKSGRTSVISKSFIDLNEEDQLFLESAAYIGYKFDADILAEIWSVDIIIVLRRLENLEKMGFVDDLHESDNLFSFKNKEIHKVIRNYNNKSEDSDQAVKQLVIEYQKRIIKSIVNKGSDYIATLDLDILQSAIQRCFKYSNVDVIKVHTPLIGLYTAQKYLEHGKIIKAADLITNIYPLITNMEDKYFRLLINVFYTAIENNTLELFDIPANITKNIENKSAITIIDDFIKKAFNSNQTEYYEKLSFIIMKDCYKRSKKEGKEKFLNRVENLLKHNINYNELEFKLRFEFYLLIFNGQMKEKLLDLFNQSFDNKIYGLSGEIIRHLSVVVNDNIEEKFAYACSSLLIISGEFDVVKTKGSFVTLTSDQIKKTILTLFQKKNLSSKIANDLNYTVSRFRDYYFTTGDYEMTIYLCNVAFELSNKINDHQGIVLSYSFHGASLYKMGKHNESLAVYKKYFDYLIVKTKDKNEFIYVIEGISLNCQALNDFSEYLILKKELYEHLLYVSNSMKEEPLKFSLFDKKQKLKDLIPSSTSNERLESISDERNKENLKTIIELLVCLATSEGNVDYSELHDISESAIALSYSLNLPLTDIQDDVKKVFSEINKLNPEEKLVKYKSGCERLYSNESIHFCKMTLHLCNELINADGVITDQEKYLMDIANQIFNDRVN
jgi:hypothetical protein